MAADAYRHSLLVELGENKPPKLKNKLIKYFQSKKSGGGGDCVVEYEDGSGTAVLRFLREEDQRNVLEKKSHQISLETGVLKMTVCLPPDQEDAPDKGTKKPAEDQLLPADQQKPAGEDQAKEMGNDEDAADEDQSSTSTVLENIESVNQEFLEMLVENIMKDQSFIVELIPDVSCAVVTFQSGKDNRSFMEKCPENRMFKKKNLSLRPLELTKKVVVEGFHNCSLDMLQLYFEREGGEVENVTADEVEQSAVITFKEHQAVKNVLKKKHQIKKEEIKVYPFYKSLGVALYGKDKPLPKLPAAISEPTDTVVLRYLKKKPASMQTVRSVLEKHFCDVTLEESTVRLAPKPSLLREKDAKTKLNLWTDNVKSAFSDAMSEFKSVKFPLESMAWEDCEQKVKQIIQNEDVILFADKASCVLSVAGSVSDVSRLEKTLPQDLSKIVEIVRREKLAKTQDINMLPSIYHILSDDGLRDKLLDEFPKIKLDYQKESRVLKVTGFLDEIMGAIKIITDATLTLKRQNLEVDVFLLDMLKHEQQEELTDDLLTASGIKAAFDISPQRVQLVALSDTDLMNAQEHVKQQLITHYIDIEDNEVLKKPEWQQLVSELENTNSASGSRIRIQTKNQQVVVSGEKDLVIEVDSELAAFLKENAYVKDKIPVKASIIIEFLNCHASWFKKSEGGVDLSFEKDAVILSGSRAAVQDRKALVEDLISSVCFDSLKFSKPGVRKFFQDKELMFITSIKSETGCLVQVVDEADEDREDFDIVQVLKPTHQVLTADGVQIAVSKADICSYPVDAVVNPSTDDLKHGAGLAKALSEAAGPQMQDACDSIILSKGKLKPGDCVVTDAGGQLGCKKVIHAVGPWYDQTKPKKSEAQLKRTVKESLELAERHGCSSVAIPAISKSLSFPLNLCAATIVRAVKEYCDEKSDDSAFKRIHLVDNDVNVVLAMVVAVKQEFGGQAVGLPQQVTQKGLKFPQLKIDQSLCHVQTKEGLDITLKKGNIELSKTEVIVNTVADDLVLSRGAISKAILSAAGSKLQQLVDNQKAQGTPGEIVVTANCKLKCKQVFHAVAPSWDNGQGAAEKTLAGIFKNCLDKAENMNLASISFPAVGTGNLGFPKGLVANLMLDKIIEFSSQRQSKHLNKVSIVLYSGDAQTIKVFTDEFLKKFPSVPVPSAAKSSQQTTGFFSKIVSSSSTHETKFGNVTLQVATGDITKETTDVIVNSTNDSFSLKSGVSKAILDAAGNTVVEECQYLGSQPNPGMIMTQPGNLKCNKILHLVGQTDPVKINHSVKEALQMCVKNSHTSVSFPAIGTGQGNVQAKQVADAMLDAVVDVLSQNTSSSLTLVRIVIFQQQMLQDFYSSMQERDVADLKEKVGFFSDLGSKIKAFFTGSHEESKAEENFIIETVKVEPVCFHICGDDQQNVDEAKRKLNLLISEEITSLEKTDNAILSFSAAECQQIVDIQKSRGVSIRNENTAGEAAIVIEGLSKDVLKASNDIDKMLKKVRADQELEKKLYLASTVADWQFQRHGLQFQSFDLKINYQLEHALEKGDSSVKITIQGQDYTVTMPKGPATDLKGNILQIRRNDKLRADDIPEFWEQMPPGKACHAFEIQNGSSEYAEVFNLFQATCKRTVSKIQRIQNPAMWKSLQIKKNDMEIRNGHQNNERRLFHGTNEATVPTINENGFNRSYAGKNATCYGKGSYFAVNANYSAQDTYSRPSLNGNKFMYLCRVLTGDFTVGSQNMIAPPAKTGSAVHLYDSVVDNMTTPNMFVVFHDTHAYPEYLITFK